MFKQHCTRQFVLTSLTVASALVFAATATADTIYLKNGRIIRSSMVRVEGDRVIFLQYGGEVSMPMSLVDRIVEDANTEPTGATTPAAQATDEGQEGTAGDPDQPAETEEVPPEQTREFWQDRVRSIAAEREQIQLQIEDLRRTERAFLFSRRSTAETRQSIEDAQARLTELDRELSDLREEARRAGVPAGWLRLDPAGGGEAGGSRGGQGGSGGSAR